MAINVAQKELGFRIMDCTLKLNSLSKGWTSTFSHRYNGILPALYLDVAVRVPPPAVPAAARRISRPGRWLLVSLKPEDHVWPLTQFFSVSFL